MKWWSTIILILEIGQTMGKEELILGLTGMVRKRGPPFNLDKAGAALPMAVDFVNNNDSILSNYTLKWVLGYDHCDRKVGLDLFVKLVMFQNISALIGPPCSQVAMATGLLASQWNIPLISWGTSAFELSDKAVYDTFSRSLAPYSLTGLIVYEIAKQFQWKTIGIVASHSQNHWRYINEGSQYYLANGNVTLVEADKYHWPSGSMEEAIPTFKGPLVAIAKKSRSRYSPFNFNL